MVPYLRTQMSVSHNLLFHSKHLCPLRTAGNLVIFYFCLLKEARTSVCRRCENPFTCFFFQPLPEGPPRSRSGACAPVSFPRICLHGASVSETSGVMLFMLFCSQHFFAVTEVSENFPCQAYADLSRYFSAPSRVFWRGDA